MLPGAIALFVLVDELMDSVDRVATTKKKSLSVPKPTMHRKKRLEI